MHFLTLPLYEAEIDAKSVRINPHQIIFYKEHLDDGTQLRVVDNGNIYVKLTVAEVDALVDRAL